MADGVSGGRVSGEVFHLDTKSFDQVITSTQDLADLLGDLKNNMDRMKDNLMFSWAGDGRNTFEKKYRLLSQQFGDLRDEVREISQGLIEMEEAYIQADTDLAKALDGKDSRY
ncbi:MAG TPA: WXG100 family type VII secretion target [Candidatus Scybalocola faecavium]|nr:WXG100 family type VII secretion target [Candidatus Scybalocola faecavium]